MMTVTNAYQPFDELSIHALKYTAKINGFKLTLEQIKTIQDQQQKLRPFPDVKNGLEQIKSQLSKTKIMVLTNGGKEQTENLLDNAGIRNYFSEIVSVESIKCFKPSPEPYHKAAEEANIPITDIVLVSSNLWDIMGAQITGMKTCWVNRESYGIANEEIDGVRPTYNLSSIEDIPNMLKRKNK
jgi:2-haloacid dehalogenase